MAAPSIPPLKSTVPSLNASMKGHLAKEKDFKMGGRSTGFNLRYFVLEPGKLQYWDSIDQVTQPAKGCMLIDEQTVLSNVKQARPGKLAFRLDRLTSADKQKYVLAAPDRAHASEEARAQHTPVLSGLPCAQWQATGF